MSILKKTVLILGDIILLYLALSLTLAFRYGLDEFIGSFQTHIPPFSLIFPIWLIIFYLADLYRQRSLQKPSIIFRELITAVIISGVISTMAFYLFGDIFQLTPKTNLLIFGLIFFFLDFLFRNGLRNIFTVGALNTGVIGDSPLIRETINYLNENPQAGYKIVGAENRAQLVVVQPHLMEDKTTSHLIYQLLHQEINVINFCNFYETIFEKVPLEELPESWFVENISTRRPFYDAVKRLLDFLLAFIGGLILLPFAVLIAALIKLASRGPAIYRQPRFGKHGKIFTLYKFRTMYHNSGGPHWTTAGDQRVTPFGKFLRFTHLDETPQLWNIIRGDISFIGPRPERKELAKFYQKLPYYEIRHIIKPGLTGWAQINYRPSASLEEAEEKLRYDIYYIKNRSLVLDFLILLRTVKYLFISPR
jgi:exopolysaccharide biosynthesis polyprenyl glycosylphosphotransferase